MINFKMNRKIEIYSEDELKIGDSTVQDEDESSISISLPMGANGQIKLVPGETIRTLYCGEGSRFYEFITEVNTIISGDGIPLIKINKPDEYQIIQKREFVRVPIILDIKLFVIDEKMNITHQATTELEWQFRSKKWIKGYAYDISAGGLGTVLQEPVDYGKQIVCLIKDEYFDTGFIGKVVCSTQIKQSGKNLHKIGIQFLGLDYKSKEKLVKYTFQKMHEQLKVR